MRIPYIREADIQSVAAEELTQFGVANRMPVDVELLIEGKLGMEIIPIPGLQRTHGVDGFLSQDCLTIRVDEGVMKNVSTRYRFTLAHELGHYFLHGEIIKKHINSIESEREPMLWETLSQEEYARAEFQAHVFASALLIPSVPLQEHFQHATSNLSKLGRSFEMLEDASKMRVVRACAATFDVSPGALRVRLIREGFVKEFSEPGRGDDYHG